MNGLLADGDRAARLREESRSWPSWDLTPAQLCDLELLLNGGFSPLRGFMGRADHDAVRDSRRLADGTCWPVPVTLEVPEKLAGALRTGATLALRDGEGVLLAALHVDEMWASHAGGAVEGVQLPVHYDARDLRRTPAELRAEFAKRGWSRIVAYPTRGPISGPQRDFLDKACRDEGAGLLILALAGPGCRGELDRHDLVRCCRAAAGEAALCVIPLAARNELLQAIVARNYGATRCVAESEVSALPDAPEIPGVAEALRAARPPRSVQGITIFFTGLSGAGKSTAANVLREKLLEHGGRRVTLLDGDLVRKHLSAELGFSKEHRDVNIRRIGYVASEITKHGGIALCAPIAPYDLIRKEVRAGVEEWGGFILIHMSAPLETCEARDRKGLYAKARAGIIKGFTGISDPYEPPPDAEITIDTTAITPEEAASQILDHLKREGFLA